ncbi:MAG: ATP synthase F0 subunit B [Desulfosudaceae bacterium]
MSLTKKGLAAGTVTASAIMLGAESALAESAISVFPDKSLIWQIINFIILIWALNLVLYKPIRNVIARRKEKVDSLDSHIDRYQQDVAEKETALTEGIKTAKSDGMKKKNELIEKASEEEKSLIEEMNQKTQQTISENKTRIAAEAEKAAAELQQEVEAFAAEIGQKILGREVA